MRGVRTFVRKKSHRRLPACLVWTSPRSTEQAAYSAKPRWPINQQRTVKPGRKPPNGKKKQFLTSMDPDVIRRIKAAAAPRDKTASRVLEGAAKEWLLHHQDGKK
jgi:hypothetical protein